MWAPVRNWKEHRLDVRARRLVDECESLLCGHYAYEFQVRRIRVPPWAWISALAHASRDHLVELGTGIPARRRGLRDPAACWQAAVAFLATELLTTTERSGRQVEDLQRYAVLPFELGQVSSATGASSIKAAEFVRAVLEAFACFRDGSYPQ